MYFIRGKQFFLGEKGSMKYWPDETGEKSHEKSTFLRDVYIREKHDFKSSRFPATKREIPSFRWDTRMTLTRIS